MYCPLKFNSSTLNAYGNCYYLDACQCEEAFCMVWDPVFGTCSLITIATAVRRADVERVEKPKEGD